MSDVRARVREAQESIKEEGAQAALNGGWFHDNKYEVETPNHQLWILGFDEGREVLQRTKAAMSRFK